MDVTRAHARRLMEQGRWGEAVPILERCVRCSDEIAMLMLAECCAFGHGTSHNSERAWALISESAMRGFNEAKRLKELIDGFRGQETIKPGGLWLIQSLKTPKISLFDILNTTELLDENWTIKHICLLMNTVECKRVILECKSFF